MKTAIIAFTCALLLVVQQGCTGLNCYSCQSPAFTTTSITTSSCNDPVTTSALNTSSTLARGSGTTTLYCTKLVYMGQVSRGGPTSTCMATSPYTSMVMVNGQWCCTGDYCNHASPRMTAANFDFVFVTSTATIFSLFL